MLKVGDKLIDRITNEVFTIEEIIKEDVIKLTPINLCGSIFTILPDSNGKSYKTFFKSVKDIRKQKLNKIYNA